METSTIIRDHLTFRVILQAMSHPGKVHPLPDFPGGAPVAVALLGCLMDNETSFAVLGDPDLETAIALHTGSRAVSPETADFIVVARGSAGEKMADLRRGSLEYPDSGATIVYLVTALSEEIGNIALTGPGIDGTVSLRIDGLSLKEIVRLEEMNNEFPLGVDAVFLDARGRICCIPRSSRIGVN